MMKILRQRDLLNKALEILLVSLASPESLAYEIKPNSALVRHRAPDALFLVEIGKGLRKKWQTVKEIKATDAVMTKLIGKVFVAEVRFAAQPRFLRNAIAYLKELTQKFPKWNPLIVTPYIGPAARDLCRKEGVSYVDTVGNVGIFLEEGFVIKESTESWKKEKKELKSLFSPKATRVIRIALENPSKIWLLQDLANVAQVSLGQTYNVVQGLIAKEYAEKTKDGAKIIQPSLLLDAWASSYKFAEANSMSNYYAAERDYTKLFGNLARAAVKLKYDYAFTLFAASSLLASYVRTPFVHLYLLGDFAKFARAADLKPVTSGGNVNLVTPYDEGVMNPSFKINDLTVIGKIQLYLDLINYPARGKEQAEFLREKKIGF